jgi:putative sigma-54 modulation protein
MMEFTFTFKGLESSEALKQYAEKKFSRLEKYFYGPVNVQVVFRREKFRELVEVIMSGDGEKIIAKEETTDIYEAIDLAYETLEKQVKKKKAKRKGFKKEKLTLEEVRSEKIYTLKTVEVNPMSTEEALQWFEKNQDTFMLFYNTDYEKICLIYMEKNKPVVVVPELA